MPPFKVASFLLIICNLNITFAFLFHLRLADIKLSQYIVQCKDGISFGNIPLMPLFPPIQAVSKNPFSFLAVRIGAVFLIYAISGSQFPQHFLVCGERIHLVAGSVFLKGSLYFIYDCFDCLKHRDRISIKYLAKIFLSSIPLCNSISQFFIISTVFCLAFRSLNSSVRIFLGIQHTQFFSSMQRLTRQA